MKWRPLSSPIDDLCRCAGFMNRRSFSDHLRVPGLGGKGAIRIPLHTPKVIGTYVSRGTREYVC